MRKKFIAIVIMVCFLSLSIIGCGSKTSDETTSTPDQEKPAEVITLKIADVYPTTHAQHQVTLNFIKKLEDTGRIKVEYFPATQLVKANNSIDVLKNGIVDIAYCAVLDLPGGTFDMDQIVTLPGYFQDSYQASEAYERLIPLLEDNFKKHGVKPLFHHSMPQYQFFTKKPIKGLDDLKGMRIRTPGGMMGEAVAALGATPVTMPASEVYDAFQKGIVDGVVWSYMSAGSYKLYEGGVCGGATLGSTLGTGVVFDAITEKAWNKLPDDLKEVVLKAAEETTQEANQAWMDNDAKALELFKEAGIPIYELTDADNQKLKAVGQQLTEKFVKDMEAKGYPAQKVNEEFQKAVKEIVK